MTAIGFILEKVSHGGTLTSGEVKILSDEIEHLVAKLEGCAQEVARREEADKTSHQQHRDRADRLRLSEEEGERLRDALAHAKRQRITEHEAHDAKVRELEGILRDAHYALLYQPELTREQISDVIATAVTPHPKPL